MPVESCLPPVPHVVLRNRAEVDELFASKPERQWLAEELAGAVGVHAEWTLPGWCGACEAPRLFHGGSPSPAAVPGAAVLPNWRETLLCRECGLINRQRLIASAFSNALAQGGGRKVAYLHEQITTMYQWAIARHGTNHEVVGSEYLGPEHTSGDVVDGIRHEDALSLSFDDASIDVVLSTDVLEHVPDIDLALAEASRTLRPGGVMLFSIPFHYAEDVTVQRASLGSDGTLVHHLAPEFHGNPVSPDEGSLVFYDYGWDLMERIRDAGFDDAACVAAWSLPHGIIGERFQPIFIATKA